jgi:transcriptional regulator with XRE-family HTH domain
MNIKKIRQNFGLTQVQFAEKLGVSFATVNRWENKRYRPSKSAQNLISLISKKPSNLTQLISDKATEYVESLSDRHKPTNLNERELAEFILNEFLQWLGAEGPIQSGFGWKYI